MSEQKVLMVLIEPTQYISDLLARIATVWQGKIDVIFLEKDFTQNWKIVLEKNHFIMPNNLKGILKTLYQCIIKGNYQRIFLAGWSHPITLAFLILAKCWRIPVVVDSDTQLFISAPFWKRIIKRFYYPLLFKLPNTFLPAGTRQAKYLNHYGVPSKKIILEKMTVDVAGIQKYINELGPNAFMNIRQHYAIKETDFVFLYVGRLLETKGLNELLQAFLTIKNPSAKLVFVGDGPMKTQIEDLSNQNKNICYAGWLTKTALIDIYFMSNVMVLPSYKDNWGLVVNEAMAAGKPVIVSDLVGCVDDLVIPKKTGLIVKTKSVDDLYNAMVYFLENPLNYAAMSKNALELISTWTLENEAKNIISSWQASTAPALSV